MRAYFKQEFTIDTKDDVTIESGWHNNSTRLIFSVDLREILDQIDPEFMYDQKGEEILKNYTKDELERAIEENF